MANICVVGGNICGTDSDTCKGRHRRRKLKSGDGNSHDSRIVYGMGYGFSYERANGNCGDKSAQLDIFDFIGVGNRCVLALLLQSFAGRRSFKGRADRQVESRFHRGIGGDIPA